MPSERNSTRAMADDRRPAARGAQHLGLPRGSAATPRRRGSRSPATGSTTRRPAWTRRTASASWAAGVSLTTKPGGTRLHRATQEARSAEGRHDQHPHLRELGAQRPRWPRCRPDRASPRRAARRRGGAARTASRTWSPDRHLGHHLEVALESEQRGQRSADQSLVVGEQEPDRCRSREHHGEGETRVERSSSRRCRSSRSARSRSPSNPWPPPLAAGGPRRRLGCRRGRDGARRCSGSRGCAGSRW